MRILNIKKKKQTKNKIFTPLNITKSFTSCSSSPSYIVTERLNISQYFSNGEVLHKTVFTKKNFILIADDNQIINDSNKRVIENICRQKKLEYEIIPCNDGIELLKYICDEAYFDSIKFIITDENMEILNGSEIIKILRIIELRKKAERKTVISVTSHDDSFIIKFIKESGADAILSKPLSKSKLMKLLN